VRIHRIPGLVPPRIRPFHRTAILAACVAAVAGGIAAPPARGAEGEPAAAAIDPDAVKNLEAAFPKAPAGRERKVILLPHKERGEEDGFLVELVVGRTITTDGINRYSYGGKLVPRDIQGWGFTYHEVEGDLDKAASTLMAGTPNPAPRFVAGPRATIPYNSRLPVVVMVPEGCELHYRIWRADPEFAKAASR
jgi:ecotin